MPFYFVRHGQTDWNKEHRGMGQTDIPLNEIGIQQAHAAAKNIAYLEISKIVSSPLKRAIETSEIIASTMNISIIVLDELKECSWGSFEGQLKGNGEWIEYWRMGGIIEGAEHWSHFVSRVATGINTALKSDADDKPILIVAHGGVYWAIQEILKLKSDGDIPNCCPVFHKPPIDQKAWSAHVLE